MPLDSSARSPTEVSRLSAASEQLLEKWQGPFGGVPNFAYMASPDHLAALQPALETAMAETLAQIDAIVANPAPPDFGNTVAALEATGARHDRVETFWRVWARNLSTPEFRRLQTAMVPKRAAFRSAITQNAALFQRVAAVHNAAATMASLRSDQRRLVQIVYDRFARNGATLTGAARDRYAAIETRLAELHTEFSNNILADEEGFVTYLGADELGGLPLTLVAAATQAAADRGRADAFAVTNTRSSVEPFLTYSHQRVLRERVWRNYYARGDNNDAHDTKSLIPQILQLRQERVALLGYHNYAQWRLENRMAGEPSRALALMERLWPAAVAKVAREVAAMQTIADAETATTRDAADKITIEPWDYRYYAEKVRRSRYDLDSNEVAQYLQLEKLREAMFFVAGELFGFAFSPIEDGSVPVFHDDVRVWEVTHKQSHNHIGLWYLDPYARVGKRSGAWATTYRVQSTFAGARTVLCSNNSNFIKGEPGQPVLISWGDAETLFHEFGHALHALSADVAYPTLNGGVRDYTEFHSQLFERWLLSQPVLDNYLLHYETGEPIPAALVAKLRASSTFNQGFATTEYLASALIDMRFHTIDPAGLDVALFEQEVLAELKMPSELVMRHRSPHFGHVFNSEGYAAGYYGYIWSEVLAADAAEAFAAAPGGLFDAELAAKLVKNLYAPRNSVDPLEAYRAFRGRDAQVDALLRSRGLLPEAGL